MDTKIQKIINDWNPIEIYPLLQNEYQYEIKMIQDKITNKISIKSLSDVIYSTFKDSFGEQFAKTNKDCEEIARQIL